MDIAALSILKNQAQLRQDVGIAVLKKAMGTAEQGGSLINRMLDKAAEGKAAAQIMQSHLGSNINTFA
ncbi:Putative motility protein [Desulfotomaculum arcticum]|uniref:Putative motility protein n=1 Tax=Desulfotruncus arcticus DSM 17038 TaxID=1121424 RepID=A0A1I2MVH3_9FIRM|nr:YjfB family protein [Desulfotruncus arcticus]SFF95575.1 Putative motility protein [Desulfotomaculum arcticum] [Desulfotruncus arcticus DSM 17038]